MKTPLTIYGGKTKLAPIILPLIPSDHKLYNEPFCGGAAILFEKEPSEIEVINDKNKELINFYKIVQHDFISLEKMIKITLHSRTMYDDALVIYKSPHLFTEIQRAWAVWILATQSFSAIIGGSFGFDKKKNTTTKKIMNKGRLLTEDYAIRLQNVQLENADALYIINSRDSEVAFHYCDPPYFNSDCGHYKGYSEHDMSQLLDTLASIKGKFLLSSYPSELLSRYIKKYKWYVKEVKMLVSVNSKAGSGTQKTKVEVLTANYPIE